MHLVHPVYESCFALEISPKSQTSGNSSVYQEAQGALLL